jgi:hypothetical protein
MPLPDVDWTTGTPLVQDTPGLQQPNVVNDTFPGAADGHRFRGSMVMALRDKLQNAYQEIGTNNPNPLLNNLPPTSLRARVAALESISLLSPGTVPTTDATPTVAATLPLTAGRAYWMEVTVVAREAGANWGLTRYIALVHREGAGAVIDGFFLLYQMLTNPLWQVTLVPNGNNVDVQVKGVVGSNINWDATVEYRAVA